MAIEAEDLFRSICESAGVAMIATDEHLRIRFWNPAAERMFGRPAAEMIGQPAMAIVPDDRRRMADRLLGRTFQRGETSELEFLLGQTEGRPRCLAVTISPLLDAVGTTRGACICLRDVTRRMQLEQEISESKKMAALGAMAGGVAHHFNNLLGGILTSIDFTLNADDPDMLRRTLGKAATSLARATELTRSLLAFSEGDHSFSPVVQAVEVVRQFAENLRPKLAGLGIDIRADLQDINAHVRSKYLLTILENLTSNACEAMAAGGGTLTIELRPSTDGRSMMLRVSDTGVGISDEDLPHVFEPFFTTKNQSGSEPGSHAGLGLAVVHGIVSNLKGTIELTRNPAGGTICSVEIPLARL